LKSLLGFLCRFEENAAEIFRKFEAFAKGFIDVENLRFSVGFRCAVMGRVRSGARPQPDVHHDRAARRGDTARFRIALALV
jgi:hypothetical protein